MPGSIIYTPSLLGRVAKAAGLMNSYSLPILTFVKLPYRGARQNTHASKLNNAMAVNATNTPN